MENSYFVNFGTGAGNEWRDTLEQAKAYAEAHLAYTQTSIHIEHDDEVVATLPWYGVRAGDDDVVIADYADFGFYGEWTSSE